MNRLTAVIGLLVNTCHSVRLAVSRLSVDSFERFDGEIFTVVDGDATAAIDERETATRSGLTVRSGLKERIKSVRVENVRERSE